MVLETLAAVGLASNVIQFVDFTCKLVAKGFEHYKSTDGMLAEHIEFQTISKKFDRLAQRLSGSLKQCQLGGPLSVEEVALQGVLQECMEIGVHFSQALQQLKAPGNRRIWKSVRQALKNMLGKDHMEDMILRLRLAREDLSIHLLVVINDQQRTNAATALENTHLVQDKIIKAIHLSNTDLKNQVSKLTSALQEAPAPTREATFKSWKSQHRLDVVRMSEELSVVISNDKRTEIQDLMLHSLDFPQLHERYDSVATAHRDTFRWILDHNSHRSTSWTGFADWLSSEPGANGLYWIAGKAGSGKSTLMKFILREARTKELLSEWAGSRKLILGSCFFWSAGSNLQKSYRGLFQSLLFQILSQLPEMIEAASPWRWRAYELGSQDFRIQSFWTDRELELAFDKVLQIIPSSARICLFIDGLDEFSSNNYTLSDMVSRFKRMADTPSVKVCVSSRPWLIFEDEFRARPSLRLQQLTHADIDDYVQKELVQHPRFTDLRDREDAESADLLVKEIVDKALGVFLWVVLVVRDLREGLRSEDTSQDLQRRLQTIPADLDDYFAHMMAALDSIYLEQAWTLFQVALTTEPIDFTLLTYTFVLLPVGDILKADAKVVNRQELEARCDRGERRLNSRCRGLLEVHENGSQYQGFCGRRNVGFLHRTVRDFLRSGTLDNMLPAARREEINVYEVICKSYLGQMKCLDAWKDYDLTHGNNRLLIMSIFENAQIYEVVSGKSLVALLDETDKIGSILSRDPPASMGGNYHWTDYLPISESSHSASDWQNSLLTFFILSRTSLAYVKGKIEQNPSLIMQKSGRPLIDYALREDYRQFESVMRYLKSPASPDLNLLGTLLSHGADPDSIYEGTTVWHLYQEHLAKFRNLDQTFFEATRMLVEHGASFTVHDLQDGRKTDTLSIIQRAFGASKAQEIEDLYGERGVPVEKSMSGSINAAEVLEFKHKHGSTTKIEPPQGNESVSTHDLGQDNQHALLGDQRAVSGQVEPIRTPIRKSRQKMFRKLLRRPG